MEKPAHLRDIKPSRPTRAVFLCACGKEFEALKGNVTAGRTSSCGCLRRKVALQRMADNAEAFSSGNEKHGLFCRYTYQSYNAMMQRCYNPNRDNYEYYGGRGITVCDEWKGSFEAFIKSMGPRPKGMTLDRVKNDLGYSPDNCEWASMKQQSNNRRARGTSFPS